MELIRVENLCKTYHLGEVDLPVLKGISLSINRGEMVALMGASGSGKTTLMNILGCLDHPTAGNYWFDGQEMSALKPNERAVVRLTKIGFVFQNFNLLPRTSALQNVIMPLDYDLHRPANNAARQTGMRLLEHIGLADRMEHEPSQLSGGQQQRVAIARALVNHPMLLLADEPTGNLDSHTSVDILRMFQRLNAEGITVLLVTHDPQVARFAHRTIHISDGMIDGEKILSENLHVHCSFDTTNSASTPDSHPALPHFNGGNGNHGGSDAVEPSKHSPLVSTALLKRHSQPASQKTMPSPVRTYPIAEACNKQARTMPRLVPATFITALKALRRNMMRSALTALGIVIGVGAVIAMMEIGNGSKTALQKTIANMGANNILIMPGAAASSGVSFGSGTANTLTPEDADQIAIQCPAVVAVAPMVRARTQIVYGNRNWVPRQIIGSTPSFLVVRDWKDFDEGQMFTDRDVLKGNQVCVLGRTVKRELFQNESPLGKEIRMNNVPFRVIGVLSPKGANMVGWDQDDMVLAPWTTIKARVSANQLDNVNQSAAATTDSSNKINSLNDIYPGSTQLYPTLSATQQADTPQPVRFVNVDRIFARAVSEQEIPQAIEQITDLLRERHHLRPGQSEDFNIRDLTEIRNTLSSTSKLMSALLLVVAMISLIVGGVGIMNIMLVSVTERTREIGLRMAVGARSHHILRQFLVEAVVLCLFGGALGILLGRGASFAVRMLMNWPTEISLPAIISAVIVSAGVGIVFGFYPAWKASKLDPIEALRYE
ncbi:MAG: ABC transporter permease [Thermoguttaceae bacterium]